jgi:hypothetical protein
MTELSGTFRQVRDAAIFFWRFRFFCVCNKPARPHYQEVLLIPSNFHHGRRMHRSWSHSILPARRKASSSNRCEKSRRLASGFFCHLQRPW